MKSGTRGVCIIAALMVILLASGTVASAAALLSGDEMNGLRGGNSPAQKYCVDYVCGAVEDCLQGASAYCRPWDPNYPCDNLWRQQELVENCGVLTPNPKPCDQGPLTECGGYERCNCKIPLGQSDYLCYLKDIVGGYAYFPCQ